MTKYSVVIFFTLTLMITLSCNSNKKEEKKDLRWDDIEIQTKTQKIVIFKESDTATFEQAIYKKVKRIRGNGYSTAYKLDTIEKKIFVMTESERDSIYKYTHQIITNPAFTDVMATCYAGYVLVKIRDRRTTLMCEYESVGEWSTVNNDTKKLYDLLKTKIDIAKQ
ncbi:hypothetical protein [Flavobacterium panacagri]|uniref:hypothetical protein n=1 Tax=Flavobacterium panacagri TaxID=3034146 RepID=UPI0025A58C8B|nr:hypothetical protein [Flavobacterium panacagri]